LHGGQLQQVTHDHSLVEELLTAGEITPQEAAVHPNRSIITRALGGDEESTPDIYSIQINPADRLLLCSDGLSGMIDDNQIRTILSAHKDPQQAADALVEAARTAGGYDNITAIVVDALNAAGTSRKRRRRRSGVGVLAFFLVFVLLVGGAVGGMYVYAHNSAYLINQDGYVTVYRGIASETLPGVSLKWLEYRSDVKVEQLSPVIAQRLATGIQVDSLDAANTLVEDYKLQAQAVQAVE
jgi:protein phosphatase